jgi:DNA recombination-dependent growth factor C
MKALSIFSFSGDVNLRDGWRIGAIFTQLSVTGGKESHGIVDGSVKHIDKGLHFVFALETKKVPSKLIKERLGKWIESQPEKPSKKEAKEQREAIEFELISRALPVKKEISVFIQESHNGVGWIYIESVSNSIIDKCLSVISTLIDCHEFGEIMPIPCDGVQKNLNEWLTSKEAPQPLFIGDSASLNGENGEVTYKKHDIMTDQVTEHIKGGKNCTRLNMSIIKDGVTLVEFDVTNKLQFPRIKFASLAGKENQEELLESKASIAMLELIEFNRIIGKAFI